MTSAIEVRVTGRVQGVFFRDGCATEARRLGVTGWISNEADGSVRGHFEGADEGLDALVEWCRSGPPHARVENIQVAHGTPTGAQGFERR